MANISVFHTEDKEWNSINSSRSKNFPICSNYHLFKSYTTMWCRFNCHIYYKIYIIFTEFSKLNVWYYNVTHLYEVDYRLLSHISSYWYEIFMELFLSRQIDQIAPVLDTCGWRCSVTLLSSRLSHESAKARALSRTPRASSRSPRPGVDFFGTGPASVDGSLRFWVGKTGDGTNDNGEAEDTFECLGVLVLEEVLLVVGLSGGSLAEEPACVALPPSDLVGILRSVEVARFKTGEVLHTTALHECQKRTEINELLL